MQSTHMHTNKTAFHSEPCEGEREHTTLMPKTESGCRQVYERDAISAHLEAHRNDPLTRLPLASMQLTPVYLLRARAAEYRESAAAACVDAACSPACQEPVWAGVPSLSVCPKS